MNVPTPAVKQPPNQKTVERRPFLKSQHQFVLICLIPALLFYLAFRFYPLAQAFFMSFHDWRLLGGEQEFVGLRNYNTILTDPLVHKVIGNTLTFAIFTTLGTTIISLLVALILNPIRWGNSLLRLMFFLPVMTSTIAIATIWLWLYQPRFGLFNYLLRGVGLSPVSWLTSPKTAMMSIIIMSVWAGIGFYVVIFLAGLRNIPKDYYEAAVIDGASTPGLVRYITIPLLSPVLTFVFVTSLIGGFNVFQQVYLMTRGGPLDSTRTIALHIFDYAFGRMQMGIGTSMAFVLFAIVLVFTIVQMRLRRTDWEY